MWYVRLGSKVWGPLNENQLKTLHRRGELTRVHHLSTDKIAWESASSLIASWSAPPPSSSMSAPSTVSEAPANAWYYNSPGKGRVGPLSREELVQCVANQEITAKTLVFEPGAARWIAAHEVAFLGLQAPRKNSARSLSLLAVLSILVCGATATIGYFALEGNSFLEDLFNNDDDAKDEESGEKVAKTDKPDESGSNVSTENRPSGGRQITSTSDEASLREAVARVQLIKNYIFTNGSVVELPDGHGTGFCVTPSGYFLTNRHVVESYTTEQSKGELTIGKKKVPATSTSTIALFVQGVRFNSTLVHVSTRYDLAILKITREKPMPFFPLSTTEAPKLLSEVVAFGFPGVAARPTEFEAAGLEASFESEFVKATSEKCKVTVESQLPDSSYDYSAVPGAITKVSRDTKGPFVFHDADIHGGNSGGPLVSKDSVVVGINTAIHRDLKVEEVSTSSGGKGLMTINDGNLNQAYLTHQFRLELEEYIRDDLTWK